MRTLLATFADGDLEKTLMAMRRLPYDRIVLLGHSEEEPEEVAELRHLESMTGNEVVFERLRSEEFMDLVEEVTSIVSRLGRSSHGDEVFMNISGGPKLAADAALFAAFRLGVPAYHVTDRVVKLPVMKGVTATNRFTPLQTAFLLSLPHTCTLDHIKRELASHSRQSVERIMRELRRMGLVSARLESGMVKVSLTEEGQEVRRTLALSRATP